MEAHASRNPLAKRREGRVVDRAENGKDSREGRTNEWLNAPEGGWAERASGINHFYDASTIGG